MLSRAGLGVLWAISVIAAAMPLVLVAICVVSSGGCASTDASFAIDCTNYTPDSGVGPDTDCAIGWSCNSDTALYQMICNADPEPEYYDCSCSDGVTTTQYIRVDTFVCTPEGALSTGNMGCQFNIQQ